MTINLHDQRIVQNMKKRTNRKWTWTQNLHHLICQRHLHRAQEQRKIKARRRKSVVSIGKMTRQTHLRATTLILLISVIIDTSNAKRRNIGKSIRSNYAQLYFLTFFRIAWHDIFTVHRNLWSSFRLSKNWRDDVIEYYTRRQSGTFCMQTFMYTAEDWLLNFQNMELSVLRNYNHIVQTWLFLKKVNMTGLFNKSHTKEGNQQLIKLKDSRMHMLYKFH